MIKKLLMALLLCNLSGPLAAAEAIFAGGSFWVMEALFAERAGIKQLEVGWIQTSRHQTRRQGCELSMMLSLLVMAIY